MLLFSSAMLFAQDHEEKYPDEEEKGEDMSMSENALKYASTESFVVGIIVPGRNWRQDSAKATELQEKHVTHIKSLKKSNKLVGSGPLTEGTNNRHRGLYVFNTTELSEAKAMMAADEAVKSGWIDMHFYVWKTRDFARPENYDIPRSRMYINPRAVLLTVFILLIIVLAMRTFRNQSSA